MKLQPRDIIELVHGVHKSKVLGEIVQAVNSHDALEKTRLTLEGLTPGGSEYVNDPANCEAHIRERFNIGHQAKKDAVRLKRVNDALVEALEMSLSKIKGACTALLAIATNPSTEKANNLAVELGIPDLEAALKLAGE